jgi:uncharacterized membrane protein
MAGTTTVSGTAYSTDLVNTALGAAVIVALAVGVWALLRGRKP